MPHRGVGVVGGALKKSTKKTKETQEKNKSPKNTGNKKNPPLFVLCFNKRIGAGWPLTRGGWGWFWREGEWGVLGGGFCCDRRGFFKKKGGKREAKYKERSKWLVEGRQKKNRHKTSEKIKKQQKSALQSTRAVGGGRGCGVGCGGQVWWGVGGGGGGVEKKNTKKKKQGGVQTPQGKNPHSKTQKPQTMCFFWELDGTKKVLVKRPAKKKQQKDKHQIKHNKNARGDCDKQQRVYGP